MAERYKLTPEEKRERFNEYHRKYYQQNRERILAYRREWEKTNPKSAEYAEKHREYLKKYNRNYYLAHCDEIAERRRLQRRETMKHKRSMKEKAALFDLLMDRGCISEEFVRVLEEQTWQTT